MSGDDRWWEGCELHRDDGPDIKVSFRTATTIVQDIPIHKDDKDNIVKALCSGKSAAEIEKMMLNARRDT